MRITVAELIKELQKSNPSDHVTFDTRRGGQQSPSFMINGVERVDKFAGVTTIVVAPSA
jgi:hypothetical protein